MMRSQSGGVRFKNIIIIIEKDKAHYPETKMQGTGIKMYTVRTTLELTHIKEVKDGKVGMCRCYIIGSDKFCDMVENNLKPRDLKWKFIKKYHSEDEVMKAEKIGFPQKVTEGVKKTDVKKSELSQSIDEMLEDDEEKKLTPEDMAAVLMAVDDMEGMKIFPVTNENIYKVFLKTVMSYIQDEETAKAAINFYLKNLSKKC